MVSAPSPSSTPHSYGPPPVVLPSLAEMFPEHIIPRDAPRFGFPSNPNHLVPHPTPSPFFAPPPGPSCSFVVLRNNPRTSSLERVPSRLPSSDFGDGDASEETASVEEDDDWYSGSGDKRHMCRICRKRFNRPSSLRIHVNTHTGAQPYRCPFQGCGRSFNVNSNMRRHWRNHTAGANMSPFSTSPTPSTSGPSVQISYAPTPPSGRGAGLHTSSNLQPSPLVHDLTYASSASASHSYSYPPPDPRNTHMPPPYATPAPNIPADAAKMAESDVYAQRRRRAHKGPMYGSGSGKGVGTGYAAPTPSYCESDVRSQR
ncbi:hypothetical protein MVEN_02396900 [Mycena venus]|uniref:C2H2-type domain-containing protein n=1 Tax=Mycena venus TaxID=2733690 RepID=A0A8H6X2L2_9AGAR|nr:hypothetical protein MVEN_02396900 [Mycena venus]